MITAGWAHVVFADPLHCDQPRWPTCYSVGYQGGLANPGTSCPSGHSANFCTGWNAGAKVADGGNAGSSDWTLHLHFVSIPFGTSSVHATVKGPFGYNDFQFVPTSQDTSTSFHMPGNQFPSGYRYMVCADSGVIAALFHHTCQLFIHGHGDTTITMRVP